jgi:hypothetical protein
MTGTYKISLPLNWFKAADGVDGDRFYVRAFARTAMKDRQGCLTSMTPPFGEPGRRGACERHYALTNPVWAIAAPAASGCQPSSRARWRRRRAARQLRSLSVSAGVDLCGRPVQPCPTTAAGSPGRTTGR